MKNIYKVINKNGEVLEALDYYKSKECSEDFKIVIEREALGIKLKSENKNSDYVKYANKMGFDWEPNAGIGFIQYDWKAKFMMRQMEEYARKLVNSIGFPIKEVSGSNFFDMSHPVVEAYAGLFGDRLFKFKDEKKEFVLSYDASYPQFNLASKYKLSYKDLPFAHFSISDCYRLEQSGECMLLFRGRRFYMPDLHPYFKDLSEAWEWYPKIEERLKEAFVEARREYFNVAKVSSMENFVKYQDKLIEIAKRNEKEMLIEIKMDGEERYWIVDIDYSIVDKMKQVREIGCIQIDIGNAERLGIKYLDKDNIFKYPVIIHSAVPGGLERYLYMLFDNFKEYFPNWLYPIQKRIIPVSEKFEEFAYEKLKKYQELGNRCDIDSRAESVSKRIARAKADLIPEIEVLGERELRE